MYGVPVDQRDTVLHCALMGLGSPSVCKGLLWLSCCQRACTPGAEVSRPMLLLRMLAAAAGCRENSVRQWLSPPALVATAWQLPESAD